MKSKRDNKKKHEDLTKKKHDKFNNLKTEITEYLDNNEVKYNKNVLKEFEKKI